VPATHRIGFWIAAAVVVLDQITKVLVRASFALHDGVTVIPGFFDLTRVHNYGAAFGILSTVEFPGRTALLALVAAAALVGLSYYAATLPDAQALTRVGLGFIIGGAAGNLIDRLALGYVTDFFDFHWRGWHFWAFNIADAAITVGVSLMILDMLPRGRHRVSRTV
jgi:signal peptidase II